MGVVLSLKSHDMGLERQTSAVAHLGKVLTAHLDRIPGQDIRPVGVRMALVLAMVAATTAVIVALVGVVDLRHVLAVYFIPVLAATLRWGFSEGLVATFASALAAAFFFYDPIFSFYIANPTEIVGLLIFVAAAIVIGYLVTERRDGAPRRSEDNVPVTERGEPGGACRRFAQVDASSGRYGAGARQGLHRAGGLGRLLRRLHPGSARLEVAPAGAADHRDARGDGIHSSASRDPVPAAARANKSFTPSAE